MDSIYHSWDLICLSVCSVFRKHETSQIREEDTFSSKRCLEWFYEYAGNYCIFKHWISCSFMNPIKSRCCRFLSCRCSSSTCGLTLCLSKIGCDEVVGPEGMEKFCEDIGVEPENVSFLVLPVWSLFTPHFPPGCQSNWASGFGDGSRMCIFSITLLLPEECGPSFAF